MPGSGKTEASIHKSRDYIFSLPIDDLNLAKFTPFPGSPVYDDIKSSGSLMATFEEDWEKMGCMNFNFIPRQMTIERLDELFIDFYRTHFRRFPFLLGYLSMIWKSPDSLRLLLADLSGFLTFAERNKRMDE